MTRYMLDIGRILLSIIFLGSAATKIADPAGTQAYMAAYGLPMTGPLLLGAIVTELGGGLALLVGLKVRWAASLLTGFLAVATLVFHTFENGIVHRSKATFQKQGDTGNIPVRPRP